MFMMSKRLKKMFFKVLCLDSTSETRGAGKAERRKEEQTLGNCNALAIQQTHICYTICATVWL